MKTRLANASIVLILSMGLAPAVVAEPVEPGHAPKIDAVGGAVEPETLRDLVERAGTMLPESRAHRPAVPPTVDDPALREAVLNQWLDRIAVDPVLNDAERAALQGLVDLQPRVWIQHHEAGGRAMPAFAVAQRARALLEFDRRWQNAGRLVEHPDALLDALRAAPDEDGLTIAALAIERLGPQQRRVLAARLPDEPASQARDRAALELAGVSAEHESLLTWLVTHAGADEARRALQFAIEISSPELPAIAARASARPELGGLVVEAHDRSGAPIGPLWGWLDDPDLGADAARVLAERVPGLAAEVRGRIDAASALARLRMLLALRLAGDVESRALLLELAEADWLQPAQREVLQHWK
jgi:hypothetical protein